MRRILLGVAFILVLLTPIVLAWRFGRAAARPSHPSGGAMELVIITPHQEGIRREFAWAFSAWHQAHYGQAVNIDYRSFGGSDIVRYFEERQKTTFPSTGTYKVDVAWGGGDFLFDQQLKKPGYLEAVPLGLDFMKQVYPEPTLAGLPLYDTDVTADPSWFGAALASFGVVYNRDVLRHLGVSEPTTWRNLADPRLAGWITLIDPTRSASARQTYMVICERAMADAADAGRTEADGWADGMGLIRQIAANARMFADSSYTAPIMVSSGDAAAGMSIDSYGRSQSDAVGTDRMGYVEPENATIVNPDPIALVKGAEHKELAIRFIRFVLSPEGQSLWNTRPGLPGGPRQTALRRLPIRRDAYVDMSTHTDAVNPFKSASQFNKSNAREKTFGILGDMIQYSCIDLLDELRQTRALILQSPRREELDRKLGRFPLNETEALARAKQWKAATVPQRLALQRQWTDEFRSEYAALRAEAR